jgi:putative transposase
MSIQTDPMSDVAGSRDGGGSSSASVLEGLAEQLVARARDQGIALTGPGGLLSGLTKQVLETALEAELTEHLGHEHGEVPGSGGNIRNGYSGKRVRTEIGEVPIRVPRDRAGSFEPVMVPKHARRLTGFDEQVISLYAKGMTTGDIANHLADIYGSQVSKDLISGVTDAVVADMAEWQNRPLDPVYPVLLGSSSAAPSSSRSSQAPLRRTAA